MTIMFAGGLTFAFAPMVPEAYAQSNANLFISAENSQFDNYMVGPQVVEVVVIDPDIDDTDEGKGEPDVDVNSGDLRMTQAVDGNWYGYFADRKRAQIADQTLIDIDPTDDFDYLCAHHIVIKLRIFCGNKQVRVGLCICFWHHWCKSKCQSTCEHYCH